MIRRWWRAFIDRLHDHDENTCDDCSAVYIRGYLMGVRDNDAARKQAWR
jgi:hypothetical protein